MESEESQDQDVLIEKLTSEMWALRLIVYRLLAVVAQREEDPAKFIETMSSDIDDEMDRYPQRFPKELYEKYPKAIMTPIENSRKNVSDIIFDAMNIVGMKVPKSAGK